MYQAVSAQAAAIHKMFVSTLGVSSSLVCGYRGSLHWAAAHAHSWWFPISRTP